MAKDDAALDGRPAVRRGRPRRAPDEARSVSLPPIRLTIAERGAIEAEAARAGLPLSDYARRVLLGHRVKAAPTGGDAATLVELNRLGVNLNQIARQLNARGAPAPSRLEALVATIRAAVDRLAGTDAGEAE